MNTNFLILFLLGMVFLPTFSMHNKPKRPNLRASRALHIPSCPWGTTSLNEKNEEELEKEVNALAPTIFDDPSYGDDEIGLILALSNKYDLDSEEQKSITADADAYVAKNKDSSNTIKINNAKVIDFLNKTS